MSVFSYGEFFPHFVTVATYVHIAVQMQDPDIMKLSSGGLVPQFIDSSGPHN